MGLLGKEDSMKLFGVHAFPNQNHAPVSKEVVEQVVEKCGGLPLVLKVIGRRMAATQDWDNVLSRLKEQQLLALDEEQQVLEGEGLVANIAEAKNVLERLKNHALITEEEKDGRGETLKRYRIHDALLALALHILEQEGPRCYFKAGQSQMKDMGDAFTSDYNRISLAWCSISEIPLPKKNRLRVSDTTCLLLDYNLDLTALPSLSHFRRLKVLCLSHTGVVSLPHSIGQLKTLEALDFSWDVSLESIPDSLGNLTNLSYLNLADCRRLKSFPVDALLKLTKLVYLNGKRCHGMWTCHRPHHRLFEQKKCLNRRFGRLYLDGMFQALTELEVLIIDTALPVDIPVSIGKLTHLKQLEIRSWQVGTCDSFQGLPNLDILRLEGLELPLTWDWSKCVRLRTLEVRRFGQSDFKVISSMENLQELHIDGNLEGLPFLTQKMIPMLISLSLSNCKSLIGVPTISQLASLKVLNIDTCPSLKDLSISFLPNLETVTLGFCNEVTTINISECPSLRVVRIEYFPMLACVTFGGKFPRLEGIILGGFEQLPDVSLGAMDAFPQLTRLEIARCGTDQLPEWFTSLTTLRTLELRYLENLNVIPDGVARLPLLRVLHLGGCKKMNMLPFADSEDSSFYPSLEYLCLTDTSVSQEHLSQRLLQSFNGLQ
ncbi:hypothetical protein SELMODRAFT_419040 [Selaginella moellendorffii]|uniref:Uncharacterized protein n=1 Tax=Selaginella moellendorffii TaxID=88036 RepID=D8S7M5_SELML|nr:hypothetical protein SELMODRAFT_419040 [Selaginella moellendorffii]